MILTIALGILLVALPYIVLSAVVLTWAAMFLIPITLAIWLLYKIPLAVSLELAGISLILLILSRKKARQPVSRYPYTYAKKETRYNQPQ